MTKIVVATVKAWNIKLYEECRDLWPVESLLIDRPEQLSIDRLREINPRYIFFPHWSWIVPDEITTEFECICFHMTDVPYGRGGSPLQNLILRGHTETVLSALRMTRDIDAGPVYLKKRIPLDGSAQTIYERCAHAVFSMIAEFLETNPVPVEQSGAVTEFQRRKPEQSAIPMLKTDNEIFNFIRMLDADSYPRAFLEHGDYQYEFSNAKLTDEGVTASVTIKKR